MKAAVVNSKGSVVATGVRYGDLYHLHQAEFSMQVTAGRHKPDCQHQWHRRLGHRNWAAAERLLKENLATGIKVWLGRQPDLGIMKVFGSEAFFHVPETKRSKLDSKATNLHFKVICGIASSAYQERYWRERI